MGILFGIGGTVGYGLKRYKDYIFPSFGCSVAGLFLGLVASGMSCSYGRATRTTVLAGLCHLAAFSLHAGQRPDKLYSAYGVGFFCNIIAWLCCWAQAAYNGDFSRSFFGSVGEVDV